MQHAGGFEVANAHISVLQTRTGLILLPVCTTNRSRGLRDGETPLFFVFVGGGLVWLYGSRKGEQKQNALHIVRVNPDQLGTCMEYQPGSRKRVSCRYSKDTVSTVNGDVPGISASLSQ